MSGGPLQISVSSVDPVHKLAAQWTVFGTPASDTPAKVSVQTWVGGFCGLYPSFSPDQARAFAAALNQAADAAEAVANPSTEEKGA